MELSASRDPHSGSAKKRVSYFYDAEIGNYHYGQKHPMKVGGRALHHAVR